jgi:glycosyltransferase involved in cell wall biosynthesis
MDICTIVARNYLAAARLLARSFRAVDPEGTCWTLVIDDRAGEVDGASEQFELVLPEQLGIDRWDQMVAGYSVLELSTAVKPWLLRHLLYERGAERITYLDPDIQIFSSLGEVDSLLREHAVVVNPHLTAPMPRDGRRPSETDILISGSFNLGFAGFAGGQEVDALLAWWAERLATDCLVAPERGYFVDQRWMDLAPGLIESLFVLRDPGYNVAYWNLSSRQVIRQADSYEVNGRPLRFFHFSGYDPDRPELLSKHQDRITLDDHPVVRELCDGYARALAAEGHEQWRHKPYAYGTLSDGTPLDAASRAVYRQAAADGELTHENIFTDAGGLAFLDHLRGPAKVGADQGVTTYLEALRSSRSDLADAFPNLEGADGARMVAWSEFTDVVPPNLVANGRPDPSRRPGVQVAGYLHGVMGVGEHGRQLIRALESQRIPVTTTMLHPEAAPEDAELAGPGAGRETGPPPVDDSSPSPAERPPYFNLLCVNADLVPQVAAQLGDAYFASRYTLGFWAWEVSAFPERYLPAFGHLDEVWVGSRHVHDAVAEHATVPVTVIPQPVSLPPEAATAPPPPGLPEGYRFLFAFDYLSVFERKNPLAVVDAFARAFSPGSGAVLIVKTLNDDYDPVAHQRLVKAVAGHPDVHLIGQRLSARERDGLTHAADCYVSLHRAEGFGYTMAESMWAGKPVIATGYSGNLDYMTRENSYLVDYRLVPIGAGHDPYPAYGWWAEPEVEHAATLMREVFADPHAARARGQRAAAEIRSSHGPDAAGRAMVARLEAVMSSPAWRLARRGAGRPGPVFTDWVSELIRSGPVPPGGRARFGGAQVRARRGLLRVLKPLAVHERMVDSELLRAIEKLDANLRELSQSHAAALRRIEELEGELGPAREDRDPD